MLTILRGISITCFFTSYLVVLVLELLRIWGRIPGRGLAVIAMMGIGLFTHITYLALRATTDAGGADAGLLATWTDWSLLVSLGLAVCFSIYYLRRPDTIVSFFFLPTILGLIGLAVAVSELTPFTRTEAVGIWRRVHGLGMGIGTAAVLIGFLAGVMYLIKSSLLKRKQAGSTLRLPTLESLGRLNRQCLLISTTAVAIGVMAGVVMNLNRWGQVGWTDTGVLLSMLLLIWLLAATALEYLYTPASSGRKAVYLTLASLGFLILTMIGVLTSSHGQSEKDLGQIPSDSAPRQVTWIGSEQRLTVAPRARLEDPASPAGEKSDARRVPTNRSLTTHSPTAL